MAVDQLPGRIREFANYLDSLLARLDQSGGWCAVFWQRDPDGMQACLDGREVPPWDVVDSLLQDLVAAYGPSAAGPEKERARALHAAALAAHDARPGARDALADQLDAMLREQRHAAQRQAELGRFLTTATTREETDALRTDLAWARDDHDRATARCAELRARIAGLDRRGREAHEGHEAHSLYRDRQEAGPPLREDGTASPGGGGGGDGRGSYDTPSPSVPQQRTAPSPAAGGAAGRPGPQRAGEAAGRHDVDQGWFAGGPLHGEAATGHVTGELSASSAPSAPESPAPRPAAPAPAPAPKQRRKRRRGSARFAGMAEEEAAPVVVPPAAAPTLPAPGPADGRTPRGARFAGVAEEVVEPAEPQAKPVDAEDGREVVAAVEALARLRGEGRSGEAHALLIEAAHWPAARFPLLAAEMQRAGLGADWATLLWEAASLPADRLVAAADALVAAGQGADGQQILRQGVVRPAGEIGQAVLGLVAEGRDREARALLDAYVRVRTPEEAARSAQPDPQHLVPLLLQAAQGVSDERHWDLLHALRVAGFTT